MIKSFRQLLADAQDKPISEVVIHHQMEADECSYNDVFARMRENLIVMKEAIDLGLEKPQHSTSGMIQGGANRYKRMMDKGALPGGTLFNNAIARALAVSEVNACMGRIVAAPTAGACGVIPAVLFSLAEEHDFSEDQLVKALFTCSGVGMIIANRATLSGAQGGCQAECGSASAMAAAAGVELFGGSPEMSADACAMALQNTLGLVCDPIAGLVEIPCIKRNVLGATNALSAMNMALAGITSPIPADEVIDAMGEVGQQMHSSLRETAEGGLAATPTGQAIAKQIKEMNA